MAITVIKNEDQKNYNRMVTILHSLAAYPKVRILKIVKESGFHSMEIQHENEFFPNFVLEWCPGKKHLRVYIHVADTDHSKMRAGYCICTLPNGLAVSAFVTMYSFLYKYRANSKTVGAEIELKTKL